MPPAVAAMVRHKVGARLRQVDQGAAYLHVVRNVAVDAVQTSGGLVHKPILETHVNWVDEDEWVLTKQHDYRQL